jgi:hypothetical protein
MRKFSSRAPLVAATLAIFLLLPHSGERGWAQSAQPESPKPVASIPFELYGNLAYLPVSVNGSGPLWFILDSAVDSLVIAARQAAALGLKTQGQGKAYGVGDQSVGITATKNVSLRLGGIDLPNRTLIVYPTTHLEQAAGRRIDGVLGSPIFKRFVVEIDYAAQIVRLYEPKSFVYSGKGEALPIRIDGEGMPDVRATISIRRFVASGEEENRKQIIK